MMKSINYIEKKSEINREKERLYYERRQKELLENQKHNTRYIVLYAYIERNKIMERKYAWHNYDEQTLQDVMSLG